MCVCVCVHMCVEGRPASWRFKEELSCSLNPNTVWRQSFFFPGHLSLLSLKTFNWFYEVHWHYGSYSVYQNILIDGDWSHEIKRRMLLGRKAMTNLDSRLKSRDITLPTKVCLVKAMVFLVVMYGYESWTIKKVEYQRIDAFELWCWRRLLRVPWTARRSNQSILKEIRPEYSLEELMLKLKSNTLVTWRKELTHWKDPEAGKDWRQEEKGITEDEMVEWHHWLDGCEFEQAPGVGDGQGSLACCSPWGHKKLDITESLNWTELIEMLVSSKKYLHCNIQTGLQSNNWLP